MQESGIRRVAGAGMNGRLQRARPWITSGRRGSLPFLDHQVLDGHDVQGTNLGGMVLFVEHHNDVLAHRNEIVMRHLETAPVGCDQNKGVETVLQSLSDVLQIHDCFIARNELSDKPESQRSWSQPV